MKVSILKKILIIDDDIYIGNQLVEIVVTDGNPILILFLS